ncbi:S-adenosyl-L-methionine-dependent methyltransferase [Neoconidiobolus thromboides FSU 785]|nr:S-adenosyl-L-methionine-dependent methyltransferase [Neoconidiobolus thromboides FSU 785]
MKYWNKRERLFSKYNEGIWMDQEGWYSVTPEKVAKHIANRMKCDVIIDGFCGVGGNAIQFAMTCNHVIAIEKDPIRLACAKHNAEIYNVSHKIDFILGDYFEVIKTLKADCIFLSPPWGGPKYSKSEYFDLTTMMPFDGIDLFNISRQITPNIAYFLPRNSDYDQLGELVQDEECEIEEEYASYSFVAVTAYYGPKLLSNSS